MYHEFAFACQQFVWHYWLNYESASESEDGRGMSVF